jgi:hypothetical protein
MIFFLSNLIIGINPLLKEFYIIRIISICVIIFILYYNSITSSIASAFILPLSIDKITYLSEIETNEKIEKIYVDSNLKIERLFEFDINEISDFLNKLDINYNYIATIEFIPEISKYNIDAPIMILSKPFLINRFSSHTTISKFIFERLNYMVDYYYLEDVIIQDIKYGTGPIIQLKYAKFYLR